MRLKITFFGWVFFITSLPFLFFLILFPDTQLDQQLLSGISLRLAIIFIGFIYTSLTSILITNIYLIPLIKLSKWIEEDDELSGGKKPTVLLPGIFSSLIRKIISNFSDKQSEISQLQSDRKIITALIQNLNDGLLITDNEGNVTLINQSALKIFGIPPGKYQGHSIVEVLRSHHANEIFQKVVKTHRQQNLTFEVPAKKSYIHCIATPLEDNLNGSILFLFQDLTRLRMLEIVRRDFVCNVSHELRTPIASLKLIAETLQEGALQDIPTAKKFLSRMENEIDNLTQMVEELLELSRIESGQVPLDKNLINPLEIINKAVERMTLQAERAGLKLIIRSETGLPDLKVDAPRLEQVLINLIHNAIKFTNPGGRILVSAFKDKNTIIFFVRDSGIGIPPKDLDRIFERFYKTDRSRSKKGTGLGLSISRHLVESHGGRIWAESQPHQGSTIYFSIPI